MDEALRYLASFMLKALKYVLEKRYLSNENDQAVGDWLEVAHCQPKKCWVLVGLWEIPLRVREEMALKQLGGATSQLVWADKNSDVMIWKVESDKFSRF